MSSPKWTGRRKPPYDRKQPLAGEARMRKSTDHILTSHVGSLPRPDALIAANRAHDAGATDERAFQQTLGAAVGDVVRHQHEIGIDVPGDGEFGKSMAQSVNYGSWWRYSWQRLSGIEPGENSLYDMAPQRSGPGHVVLTSFGDRRDRTLFATAYNDPESGITTGSGSRPLTPICTGPLGYAGGDMIRADIANFRAALAASGVDEGFMTAVAPASCARIGNTYYKSDEEFLHACADAMREEYKAIVDAGIVLQLDDPCLAEGWDQVNPEPSVADYQKLAAQWIEALNHAISGLPPDRIRLHLCWGSWHGPHVTDIPIRDIIEVVLKAKVGAISFEAGNVRHEHEWRVWQEVKLPDDKILLPGVVSHATNVVEHPELVSDRILRFANIVGRERVIASTDCGLGGRIHPQIAWAKLEALAQGAALATKELWR
jgi:5-methyltetrahydropteroyltriglutamate--homocysteine methyltransferase